MTKQTKTLLLFSIIAVIVILFYLKSCQNKGETKVEEVENKQVEANTAKSDSLAAVLVTLRADIINTHVKDSVRGLASDRLVRYWKTKATESGNLADSLIRSSPILTQHEADNDSLIAHLENRIDTLHLQKEIQWKKFNKLISNVEERLQLETESKLIIAGQRDKFRKKANKKFSIGPSVSFGFRGVDVGISVHWSLVRF